MRYFITFACYGSHLHGHESGSVDRNHNVPGSRLVEVNPERVETMRQQMDQVPYLLDKERRVAVLDALHEVCSYRDLTVLGLESVGSTRANESRSRDRGSGRATRERHERLEVVCQPHPEPSGD